MNKTLELLCYVCEGERTLGNGQLCQNCRGSGIIVIDVGSGIEKPKRINKIKEEMDNDIYNPDDFII